MKPHRVRMTHNLVVNYGLYRMMEVFRPKPVNAALMTRFHSDDYVNFLRVITPDNMHEYLRGPGAAQMGGAARRGPGRRAPGRRRLRLGTSLRHLAAQWGRCLHLWRGDGAVQFARGVPGRASEQAAVSHHARPVR